MNDVSALHRAQMTRVGVLYLALASSLWGFAPVAASQPAVTHPPAAPAVRAASDASALAQQQRAQERRRIAQERSAQLATQREREAGCYQRFAVEDCLREVRQGARESEARLREREARIHEAERKEKAAQRLQSIGEKQPLAPRPDAPSQPPKLRQPGADPGRTQSQRDAQARLRSARTDERTDRQQSDQVERVAQLDQRAAKARARRERNAQSAQARRQRAEQADAQAAASGRKPASGLPPSGPPPRP